ncbi:hypothetical protein KFE25_009930 [Diacronema lutheri]|uniref:30S ribosomal protein S16 n=2 Tax=Diacronema lutheri TaxID=2081491 RepID=A0A8J5XI64_DIALT|nr:hypothetical protein KFE25_009930 [Diacronema lutheri]
MVLRLRLQRWGAIHKPFYRVVAADSRARRDGNFIERIGTYDPMIDHDGRKKITFNFDRAKYWLSVGAQPSDTVARLLYFAGLYPKPPLRDVTISALKKKQPEAS